MHFISSADVRSSLDRRNIPYTQSHQNSRVEITKCLDETSEYGNLLVDFLIHIVKFKETASDAQYKEVMEYMLSGECSEKDGDEVLFINDWDAVMVEKRVTWGCSKNVTYINTRAWNNTHDMEAMAFNGYP